MFTGIVEEIGKVIAFSGNRMSLAAEKVLRTAEIGASIAVNGVCLTVTRFDKSSFDVDIMEETINRTNLVKLIAGAAVNLESALTLSKGLGGHLVQGHVDGLGEIIAVTPREASLLIDIKASPQLTRYVVEKGFITVDGVSLTVVHRRESVFGVSIVGFTRHNTTLGMKVVGDSVNLEADIIAKYVESYVNPQKRESINFEFLKEHGFA